MTVFILKDGRQFSTAKLILAAPVAELYVQYRSGRIRTARFDFVGEQGPFLRFYKQRTGRGQPTLQRVPQDWREVKTGV